MHPAWAEYGERLRLLPGLLKSAVWDHWMEGRSLMGAFERLGRALPTGLLSGDALEAQIRRQFALPGRSNDFRELGKPPGAGGHRSGQRRGCALRPARLGRCAHLARRAGQRRPAGPVPAGQDRRPSLCGRRPQKDLACLACCCRKAWTLLICLNPLVPYESDRDASAGAIRCRHGWPRAPGNLHPPPRGRRPAPGDEPDLPLADPLAAGAGHEALRAHPPRPPTSCSSSPTTAMPRCSWPTPSATRSAAIWPSTPTRPRGRACAAARPSLQAALQRHGLSLNLEALNEPGRRLLSEPAATRTEDRLCAACARP